jgi:hypothetical protein
VVLTHKKRRRWKEERITSSPKPNKSEKKARNKRSVTLRREKSDLLSPSGPNNTFVMMSRHQSANSSLSSNRPVPLLTIQNGRFVIEDEAIKFLSNIRGELAVIAVAGLYR